MTNQLRGLFLLFVFAAAGCSGKPEDPKKPAPVVISVAFWGAPEEINIITDSIKTWQESHSNIQVRFEHTPFSGYTSKILTRIAGGAAPDIVATEVNMFVSFASKHVLEDLGPYVSRDTEFSLDDFYPAVVRRFTVGGRLLAIPRDTAPFACVFYNKDLFDKEGVPYPTDDWTWDELLDKAKRLTRTDEMGRVTQYGFYGWAWQNFLYSAGGALVDNVENPTECRLGTEASKMGLQFYSDLINKHRVMPAPVALANLGMGIDIMFSSGRLAMFLSGIWETPTLRNYNFKWDVASFPAGPSGVRRVGTGGTGYAILKSSRHKQEAWEVVKALTGPDGQAELARRGLAQPARRAVAEGPAFAQNTDPPANKKMLNRAVEDVVYDPFHAKWREIEAKIISPELELLFNGKETAEEAAQKMVPQVNEFLKSSD
ncbi:MAG: sugar ABC transporter substrate-binding protein [Candidatus Omnitrophica bacterium]|nr:sugar ABC transporter substrate-binding protein [Candidatus Omnitrophota bacterium]